jgi:hypothetical protein
VQWDRGCEGGTWSSQSCQQGHLRLQEKVELVQIYGEQEVMTERGSSGRAVVEQAQKFSLVCAGILGKGGDGG